MKYLSLFELELQSVPFEVKVNLARSFQIESNSTPLSRCFEGFISLFFTKFNFAPVSRKLRLYNVGMCENRWQSACLSIALLFTWKWNLFHVTWKFRAIAVAVLLTQYPYRCKGCFQSVIGNFLITVYVCKRKAMIENYVLKTDRYYYNVFVFTKLQSSCRRQKW